MTGPPTGSGEQLPPQLSDLLDQGLAIVCLHDAEGVVTWANAYAERLLGRRYAKAVGRSLSEVAADREAVQGYLSAVRRGGVVTTRLDIVGPDGRARAVQVRGRKLPGGVDLGATLLVAQEVDSVIETVERDLREEKRRADRASLAKSEFLAQMTREIRTPMNGIIGMTDLALSTMPTDQQREYLRMVRGSAATLVEAIDRVIDLSELDAGAVRLGEIDFTLWDVVSGAFEPFAPLAWDKGVELLYDEAPGVPEHLRGDPGRLRQALRNLVGDAVKLTPSGSVRLTVSVPESTEPDTLQFQVVDTGIGTPPDTVGSGFASLRQGDGITTGRFAGTGLRLAVTTGLVQLMGGELTVASTPGRGRTFTFTVPFGRARPRSAIRELPGSLVGRRALVVDDHEAQRAILADLTRRLGIEVGEAASGKEALPLLSDAFRGQRPVDVVLLGSHLHGSDGIALAERILGDPRFEDVVVVAITSGGRPGDGSRCRDVGIASYLPKPVAPRELRDAILLALPTGSPARNGALVTRYTLRAAREGLRVLLVEDNRVTGRLASGTLAGLGHEVRHARTGEEALHVLGSEAFDAILLDLGMPDMDGTAAAREIRRLEAESSSGRRTPIIAITARATVGDRERVLAAGMDDYLSKPIRDDRLSEVLRRTTGDRTDGGGVRRGRGGPPRGPLYDRVVLLERLESDIDLLRSLTSVFGADSADLLARIEGALADDEGGALERAAHTLQGAVSIFGAEKARARALLLEQLGRDGKVAEARGEYGPLRDLVTGLTRDLTALVEELERSPPPVREAP